jgi:L(+)-tartrate dehydratase beta subunit
VIIGKGGMTSEVYRKSFVPHGAIYLTTVGYGTGGLLGRGIKRVARVYWLEEGDSVEVGYRTRHEPRTA